MWSSARHERRDPFWNVVVPYRVRGPLDAEALRASVERIIHRHEILRTTFVDADRAGRAVVREPERFEIRLHDLRGAPDSDVQPELERLLAEELVTPFRLERGPLLRMTLVRTAEQDHRMLRTTHHLVHDALSWRVFFRELALLYAAQIAGAPDPLGAAPELQYLDYSVWERSAPRADSRRYRAELDWWERRFDPPVPRLELPFTRAERLAPESVSPAVAPAPAPEDGFASWGIAAETSAALDRLGRAEGATFYMSRLAAFSALVCLETGVDDIVIGTPVSTRTRVELQSMIGVFLNFAILRLRFGGAPSLRRWIAEVRRTVVDTSARVTIPTEELMPELHRRGVKLPQVDVRFVAWAAMGSMRFGGLELEPLPRRCVGGLGFRLGVNRPYETERCWTEFDAARYDPEGVRAFLSRLRALTAAACAEPDRPLAELHTAFARST
jgi:hypothetical protein